MWMGHQDCVKGMAPKEVSVFRISLLQVYHWMYFYYLHLFVIHVLLLDKLRDLLMYLSLSVIRCLSAELLHVCQTLGVLIEKWLPH